MNTSKEETQPLPDGGTQKDARDLLRGALVNYLGALAKVSKFLFVLMAARIYGVADLGLYFLAWAAVDLASKFGLWGIDRSLIRDIARYYADESEQTRAKVFAIIRFNIGLALALSVLVSVVLFSIADFIAVRIFNDANLTPALQIFAFAIPFTVLTQTLIATTKALRIMRYEVLIRLTLEPLVMLLIALLLIPFDLGAEGLVSAHVIACIVATVASAFAALYTYRNLGWHATHLSRQMKIETIRFTSPMAVMDFVTLTASRLDIMLVGAMVGTTAVGAYGIAVETVSVIRRVRQGLEPIFAPIVSELFYSRQKSRLKRSYIIVTRWLLAGALLPVLAMTLYPAQLLAIFSADAMEAKNVLVILALAHGLYTALNASENLLVMSGRSFLNMILGIGTLLVSAIVCVPLILVMDSVGAAVGMLITYACISAARVLCVYKLYDLHPLSFSLFGPLANALLLFVLFYILDQFFPVDSLLTLIPALAMLVALYLTLYFWGPKEPEEEDLLARLRRKFRRTSDARSQP